MRSILAAFIPRASRGKRFGGARRSEKGANPRWDAPCYGGRLPLESRASIPAAALFKTMDPRFIDDLARRLSAAIPESVSAVRRDLEGNFKAVLQSTLARLDLVTRQEFDVQAAVLRRTREKLEALEARLAAFEQREDTH
jgi:BMFP domain-containing protein YqiC